MDVLVVSAAVGQPVNQPGIAMIGENDRLIGGKQRIEILIAQSMRMLGLRLDGHQIDDIDHAHLQVRKILAQHAHCGQCLQRRDITGAGHYYVRLAADVVAGPFPDTDARGAVLDGGVHVQPLQGRLFA